MKDYYKILNLSQNATNDEIKKAFRKKAIQFHPDKNASKDAAERFREIYEAYEILSNSIKRIEYDKLYNSFFTSTLANHNNDDLNTFEETIKDTKARSEQFSKMSYTDFEIYLRIIFNKMPDLILTVFIFLLGSFLSVFSFTNNNPTAIILGLLIGLPLLIVSIRDFNLILKIKNHKEKLSPTSPIVNAGFSGKLKVNGE